MHGSVKRIFEMSILTVFLGVTLYVVLGMIWIKGASYVKEHSPKHLPNFYMTLTVIRVTSILMMIGLYLVFVSKSYRESISFVIMMLAMYALMMIVTLLIRH